jgi:site-specific recombinase XerD
MPTLIYRPEATMSSARALRIARYRRRRIGAPLVSGAPTQLSATSAESKLNDDVATSASAIPNTGASRTVERRLDIVPGRPFSSTVLMSVSMLTKSQVRQPDAPGIPPDQVTEVTESGGILPDRAVQTQKEEDMRHPAKVWTDPDFERESLERLRLEFKRNNLMGYGAHGRKMSIPSVNKYDFSVLDFLRSLERHGIEPVLGGLTPDNVATWQQDQENRGNSPHGIASRIIGLKVFSNKFIFKTLELTTVDLLRKVERPSPKLIEPEILTPEEVRLVLDGYDRDTFGDVRDRAFVAILAATGLRYNAVLTMRTQDYDRVTGEFKVHEKGDEDRPALVDGPARRFLNLYLARRPRTAATDRLWVTEVGSPLSYAGGQMLMRRAKARSGITRVHAHLFRHGIAHRAADQGADLGEIQLLLGHSSPAMARRYTGSAAKRQGARLMPRYSPV